MDLKLLVSAFGLIFIAELPGKTTFANMLLASRVKPLPVFIGAAAAYVIHCTIAVAAGSLVSLLPVEAVEISVGTLFLILAWLIWRRRTENINYKDTSPDAGFFKALVAAFTVTFAAQWGDPSQVATAGLAARFSAPATLFAASFLALCSVTCIAIAMGRFALGNIHPRVLQKIVATIFAGLGLYFLFVALH